MRTYFIYCLLSMSLWATPISFQEILQYSTNPQHKQLQYSIEAKKQQANVGFAATEIDLSTQNLGRDEIEFTIGQSFELGNQRQKKKNTALQEAKVFSSQQKLSSKQWEQQLGDLYLKALYHQEQRLVFQNILEVQKQTLAWLETAVQKGLASRIDLMRMQIQKQDLQNKLQICEAEKSSALQQMQEFSNLALSKDHVLQATFSKSTSLPSTKSSPLLQIAKAEIQVAQAKLEETKKPWIQELKLQTGYLRDNATQDNALLLNVGISLPLFSKNANQLASAKANLQAQKQQMLYKEKQQNIHLLELKQKIGSFRQEIDFLENTLLPQSQKVLEETLSFSKVGVFSFVDYQNAQTTHLSYQEKVAQLHQELGQAYFQFNLFTEETQNVLND